ncbi:hypothetical protein ATY75_23460 [Rhizobium sp. N122]|nr:hypothetical protein ATY75_23460 [Rhizobium sp. N122]
MTGLSIAKFDGRRRRTCPSSFPELSAGALSTGSYLSQPPPKPLLFSHFRHRSPLMRIYLC